MLVQLNGALLSAIADAEGARAAAPSFFQGHRERSRCTSSR